MAQVYDRRNNEYRELEEANIGLKFMYNTFIGRVLLKIFTARWFSNLVGFYMNSIFSRWQIKRFIRNNNINMDEYEKKEYNSFNDFFIRKIKKGNREIVSDSDILISPADSKVQNYKITDDLKFSIKNSLYTVSELLQDEKLSKEYKNGECLVLRLCVDDYHRYVYIDGGEVKETKKIDGVLHTVNPISDKKYKVYAQNSREWTIIETENFGKIIQMEVGALCVGRIRNFKCSKVKKGQEKGYFEFGGSTIIIFLKEDVVKIDEEIVANSKRGIETIVKQGEELGKKIIH